MTTPHDCDATLADPAPSACRRAATARLAAGLFIGVLAGCGTPDPRPLQLPVVVTSAASSATTGPVAAAASGPSAPGDDAGVTVEAAWVREHPELTRLFSAAPACVKAESFLRAYGATIHSYALYSPRIAQEEFERGFRESASALGYTAKATPDGLGFQDEAKGISASISEARLTVLFTISDPPAKAASTLAAALGFDTWPLLSGLPDATWKSIHIDKYAGGAQFQAELEVGAAGRADVERWARNHQLERSADSWVQKWQPAPAPRAGIVIDFGASGKLDLGEGIGLELSTGACQEHPTRKTEAAPARPPPSRAEMDELFKQMMGK
jgi:hypothetical protein